MTPALLLALVLAAPDFKPDQSTLPVPAPKGATVLLDDKGTHSFLSMAGDKIDWPVEDGALVSTSNKKNQNHIVSKLHFRDADIHVEFLLPEKGPANSGVYIHGRMRSRRRGGRRDECGWLRPDSRSLNGIRQE